MKVFRYISILLLAVVIASASSAQEKKLRRADESFEAEEYYKAMEEYTAILKKIKNKNDKIEIYYKIGECYFMSGYYKKARSNYKRAAKSKGYEVNAKNRLAEIEIQEDNFESAIDFYNQVLDVKPDDTVARKGIESANWAIEQTKKPTRWVIEKAKHLCSKANDFCPSIDEKDGFDHVYFSSTREESQGKKLSGITGTKFSDLFVTKLDRHGKWEDVTALDSINTRFDEGSPCIFDQGRKFYYTSCIAEKGKNTGCQIYEAQKVDGEWMNPTNLGIVSDSLSIGHPTVSPDGSIIYFSARLDGGYGGADIWYSEKAGSEWSKPKNMGPAINSAGDELFPYMRNDTTLFYSSTKHPTMGGLDIFVAYKNEDDRWRSQNMGHPFSSNGNDFGIYYYKNEDKGYFTSDRKGSKGEDIYFFEIPPLEFKLTGSVHDADTKALIDSSLITLYGSDGSMFRDTIIVANKKDKFNFKLKTKTDYVFVVTKDGYFNGKSRFSTDSLEFNKTFEYDILLETLNKTIEIPNIEFAFGRWELTEPSKAILDSTIRIMVENPNIVIELSAHTDMVGSEQSNMELSQKRANSVTSYFESKGIPSARMVAKGYGESKPKVITSNNPEYPFLPKGAVLNESFINSLTKEQQEVANQQNRRIEMKVLSNDYVPSLD